MIKEITDGGERKAIARGVLEALPDWFGIEEARESYIAESEKQLFFAAMEGGKPIGFLCLKPTGKDTAELAVMGVLKEYHRRGIGRQLFYAAKERAARAGYSFMQVKTVQMGRYKEYDETNLFYLSLGFKEFEVFPTLWDEWNPCQIYVMALEGAGNARNAGVAGGNTNASELDLIKPDARYAAEVMAYRDEMLARGDSLDGCEGLENVKSYEEWLNFEGRLRATYGEGYVPSEVYLAVRRSDGRLVGIIDYRLKLTEYLLNYGGNIGYSVRPCERCKGYAKQMLSLMTGICREHGESRVLVTCDKDNEASRRTIVVNGGVLENEVADAADLGDSGIIQRYWITL